MTPLLTALRASVTPGPLRCQHPPRNTPRHQPHPECPRRPKKAPTPPQHLRSPSLDDADLRLIQARHSQGRPLPPPPTDPQDPESPEVDEPWYSDPGASMDRGGWENPKPRSQATPTPTAPLTTSTPQTTPRPERPPAPQPTPTSTRVTSPQTAPPTKGSPSASSTPGGQPTTEMPSLQELWIKMSRFIEKQ